MKRNTILSCATTVLIACGAARANLMFDWTFDGAAGQTANLPEPVRNNYGTVVGAGTITTSEAVVGTGAFSRFPPNGNNDRIGVWSASYYELPAAFTISAWIKTTQANYPNILAWTEPGIFACEFRLNNGFLQANQFFINSYNQSLLGSRTVNDGAWHFVAVTRQFGGSTSLYLDNAFDVDNSVALSGAGHFTGMTMTLAGHNFHPGFDYSLDGGLDDVSLWGDERLDITKLRALHNLGISALDYNAANAAALFDVYATGNTATLAGRTWYRVPAGTLDDLPGTIVTLPGGQFGLVLNSDGSGVVSATPISGDYGGDGKVDAADYILWRSTGAQPADYDAWRTNFGSTLLGSGSGTLDTNSISVPEPTSMMLLPIAVIGFRVLLRRATFRGSGDWPRVA